MALIVLLHNKSQASLLLRLLYSGCHDKTDRNFMSFTGVLRIKPVEVTVRIVMTREADRERSKVKIGGWVGGWVGSWVGWWWVVSGWVV